MIWILLVLVAQLGNATKNVLTRRVGDSIDTYTVALFSTALMLPFLWTSVFISGDFEIQPEFWQLLLFIVPLEIVVMLLFFHALTKSELSVSFPFVSFSPFFVALGSYFILGELNSWLMYSGMALLVVGAFAHQLNKESEVNIRGALYILGVTALWGYMIPMGNLAMEYASPQLFPAIYFTAATALFLPVWVFKRSSSVKSILQNSKLFLFIGIAYALFMGCNWYAYHLGPTTGVASLGMVSILFTSALSGLYLKEKLSFRRIIGVLLMFAGAVLVTVA
jgi:drug/metabolite transporter (DMT)-like permease